MADNGELVTRAVFMDGIDHLARLMNAGFLEMGKKTATMEEDIRELTLRVEGLEKEMRGIHQNFDTLFIELRGIRDSIKEIDTRADVTELQLRVSKLEKKIPRSA